MNKTILFAIFTFATFLLLSCEKSKNIDTEKPKISIDFPGAFPVNCDTLYFGEPFTMRLKFSDNVELGSYSVDIHNNFDHHSHSTEVNACNQDEDKIPVNPYVIIQDFDIPEGQTEFTTNITFEVDGQNGEGKFDEGDYHFFVSLTDKEGWSAQMGLSIKMVYR